MHKACLFAAIFVTAAAAGNARADVSPLSPSAGDVTAASAVAALDDRLFNAPLIDESLAERFRTATAFNDALDDLEFEEGSALMRIARLKSLSLLTLGEFGQSRLFIGVNDDGFVGLHFNGVVRRADERYLELARMPYVQRSDDSDD